MYWAEPARFIEFEVAPQIHAVCLDRIHSSLMGLLLIYLDLDGIFILGVLFRIMMREREREREKRKSKAE